MADARDGDGRDEPGMSLVEAIVSITILSFLLLVILQSTTTVSDSTTAIESYNLVLVETQKAVSQMHEDVATARKIFENDALGQTYVKFVDYGTHPLAATALLPIIQPLGEFTLDAVGDRRTGNILMVVGEMSPYSFTAPSNGKTYRISVFRLICYYVSDRGFPVANGLSRFDLVRWESEAFVDYVALSNLPPLELTARSEMVVDMVTNGGIHYAWDPTQLADAAFFKLDTDVAPVTVGAMPIPASRVNERVPKGYYAWRNAALASNNGIVNSEASVPKFTQPIPAGIGFPHGFEVKVVGPSGARKIKVRVVAERMMKSRVMRRASESIATMRDI
jgi:hypothetical protein